MKKILLLGNSDIVLFNFRKEIIEKLINLNYKVYISLPYGEKVNDLIKLGCIYIETPINRRGISLLDDYKLYRKYKKMISKITPICVLTFTIKPNIYGSIACKKLKIPYIVNITGLGSGFMKNRVLRYILNKLYKYSLSHANIVFFQNKSNLEYILSHNIYKGKYCLIPGSGVNLNEFVLTDYPNENNGLHFNFIARVMKDKGIEEYLHAAKRIKKEFPNAFFHIWGIIEPTEPQYLDMIKELENNQIIIYHGHKDRMELIDFIKISHCTILPSYSEGLSNALLESAAVGRPLLASNIPGCKEVIDYGYNGYLFDVKNSEDLYHKIKKFISLDFNERSQMGNNSRKKVEKEFNRDIVVEKYINEIEKILLNRETN